MSPFILKSAIGALSLVGLAQASPTYKTQAVKRQLSANLARDQATLWKFANTITSDPYGLVANWTAEGDNICGYMGVYCETDPAGNYAVASLDFNEYELGVNLSLDGFLDQMLDLALFHANTNGFTGDVPDLSQLPYLYEIDLSNNDFSGPFPQTVLQVDLAFLDLRYNQFSGSLPDNIFTDTDFTALFLNHNQFSGSLPPTGNINTTYITLNDNQFSGPIPDDMANNVGLQELIMFNNNFEGTIPESLCALPLTILDVSYNPLITGPLGPNCQTLYNAGALNVTGTGISM